MREAIGVAVAIVREGKILLGKRISGHGDGLWQTPGGKPDPGETPEQTAVRETFEETGLEIDRLREVARQWDDFAEIGYRYETIFFRAEARGEPRNLEPDKCEGWHWIALDALPPAEERFAIDDATLAAIRASAPA